MEKGKTSFNRMDAATEQRLQDRAGDESHEPIFEPGYYVKPTHLDFDRGLSNWAWQSAA